MALEEQIAKDEKDLKELQTQLATYFTQRAQKRAGERVDRQLDLEVAVKTTQKELMAEMAEKIKQTRRENKDIIKDRVSEIRKQSADEKREVMKAFDKETTSTLNKIKTRITRLIVSLANDRKDIKHGQERVPEDF